MSKPLAESSLKSLEFLHRGKVRDLYAIDANRLLVVQTDRLSAFDVILPDPIPGKGQVLTELSTFWFHRLSPVVRNHLLDDDPLSVVAPSERDQVAGRRGGGLQDRQVRIDDRHKVILPRAGPCRRPRRPVLISRHAQRVGDQRSPADKSRLQNYNAMIQNSFISQTRLWIRELSAQRHTAGR